METEIEINPQRMFIASLASKLPKTFEIAKDPNSSYKEIMPAAAKEGGVENFVAGILQQADPVLAYNALMFIPNLTDAARQSLTNLAGNSFKCLADPPAFTSDFSKASVPGISSLELYLVSGAAFECNFSMFWLSSPGVSQPMSGTPDSSKWVWSQKLSISINRSYQLDCTDFALPNSPLVAGNTVWMVASIVCGGTYQLTQFPFVYDPNGSNMRIDTWGASVNPQFGIHTEA